ncbi:MAG: hypothetical protein IT204_02650 [Fimbriimonadaceae bacterium]|nr:hypothetical protein [Fimbriimonadaceae bacterium]
MKVPPAGRWTLDLSAKVGWRLRHDHRPWQVTCQDKLTVRQYAADRGVATAPLLAVADRAADLDLAALPAECFLKANHGCGYNLLRSAGRCYPYRHGADFVAADGSLVVPPGAAALTDRQAAALLDTWLAQRYHRQEWAYQQIRPRLFAEPVLRPRQPPELLDIRCYVFAGTVVALSLGSPRYRRHGWNAFLTPDWAPIPLSRQREPLPDPLPARPATLPTLLAQAARLGQGLDFARIDLYDTTTGPLLGEITVYPEAGSLQAPTACHAFNCWLASHWPLSGRQRLAAWCGQQSRWTAWRLRRAARWLCGWAGGRG